MGFARISCFRTLRVTKKKRIWYQGALVKNMVNHGILVKNMVNHGILAKIMVSLCTILHGHGILAKIMARSWQDLGKDTKELAMDLGKDAMASNTGILIKMWLIITFFFETKFLSKRKPMRNISL